MINCTLNDKQLEILRTKIAKDLLNYVNTGDIFSLEDYTRSIYDRVYALKGNQNLAIDYARMTLSFVKQLWGVDSRFEELNGLDVNQLATEVKRARDEKSGFESVANFIGAQLNLGQDLKEAKEQIEKEEEIDKFQQEIRSSQRSSVHRGTQKPSSPLTTTINEYIDGDPTLGIDPDIAYHTAFVKNILENFLTKRVSSDPESGIEYPGVEGGLFVTLVKRKSIPLDQQYRRVRDAVNSGIERDNIIKYYNEAYSYVITNSKGEPVQFDANYNVVAEGNYIHYNARPLPAKRNDGFVLGNYSYVQTVQEIAENQGITEEEATKNLNAQFSALEKLYDYVDSNASNKVVLSITGGSRGGLGTDLKYRPLNALNFGNQTLEFAFRSDLPGFTGYTVTPSKIGKSMPIKINALSNEDIDKIVQLLTGNVLYKDGKPISPAVKYGILSTYLKSSIKDLFFAVNASSDTLFVKYGGKNLKLTNKDEVRNAIENTIGGPKRKYNLNTDAANSNADTMTFTIAPDPRTGTPIMSYEKVPYLDFLSNNIEIQVDADNNGEVREINPYFSIVPSRNEIAKVVLTNPETVEQLTKEETTEEKITRLRAEEQIEIRNAIPNIDDYPDTYGKKQGNMPNDLYAIYKAIYDRYDEVLTPLLGTKTTTETKEEIPITVGRYVKYKDEYFIVTKFNDNGTVQIYNPTKSGTAAKKSVSPKNLTATKSEAKVVTYNDTEYLVTNKGEIISLKSNKKMDWSENDGNRVAIMELAGAPKPAEIPAPIQEVIEKGKKSRAPRSRRSSADSDILNKIKENEEWFKNNKNKLNIQSNFAATKEQIAAAEEWYRKSPLSKLVPFKVLFNVINTRTNGSIATWTTSGITLFKGADYSDLYHEAWHAFTQMFMTKEQRDKMYAEARRAQGTFKTYEGNIVLFKYATDLELEEYLAEDFREFMLGKKVSEKTPVKKGIFQWLLDLLKLIFGKTNTKDVADAPYSVSMINELYNNLKVGDLTGYTFDQANATFTTLNKVVEAVDKKDLSQPQKLGHADSRLLGSTVDALFSELIDNANDAFNTKIYTAKYLLDPSQRTIAYEYVREQLGYRLEDALVDREEATDLDDIEALDYEIDTLTYALNNFGDPRNLSKPTGLIKYHMATSKFLSFEDKLLTTQDDSKSATEPTKNEFEAKSGNEQSMQSLASPILLYTIHSLYAYDSEGNVEHNILGFPDLADFNRSWNRIVNVTDGSRNIQDIYNKLKEASADYPVIKQFLDKIGSPSTLDGASQGLWSEINKVLTMSRIPLVIFNTEVTRSLVKTDPSDPNERGKYTSTVEFRPTIAGGEYRKVGMRWDSEFAMRSPDKYVRVNPVTNTNELMVNKILEDFKFVNENNVFEFMAAIGMPLENNKTVLRALKDADTGVLKDIRDIHFTLEQINKYNQNFSKGNPIAIHTPTEIVKDHFVRLDDGKTRARTSDKGLNAGLSGSSNKYQSIQKFHLKWSDDFSDTTVSNATGENQFEKSKRSTLINNIEDINAANTITELIQEGITDGQDGSMNHLDPMRNPFMKTSMFMDAIFDENGKKRSTSKYGKKTIAGFQLLNMAGTSVQVKQIKGIIDRSGVASAAADDITKTMQDYYMMMLYGVSESVRHADKSTTYLYRLMQADPKRNHLIELIDFANGRETGTSVGRVKFIQQMTKYLSSEYERIQKLKDGDEAATVTVGNSTYGKEGAEFVVFDKILSKDTKEKLHKYRSRSLAEPVRTSEQFLEQLNKDTELKDTVEQEISEYLTKKVNDFTKRTADLKLLTKPSLVEPVIKKIVANSDEYYSNMSDARKNEITNSLAEGYVANSWLQNYETVMMFYGDPGLYNHAKDEFFKRDAGVGATGDTPRTDIHMQEYINNGLSLISYAAKKGYRPKQWGNTMNSAVMQDPETRSKYIEEYKQAALKKERERLEKIKAPKEVLDKALKDIENRFEKAYGKMTEGDGQGWIGFDAYRSLLKSLNKWSSYQEDLYRKIVNEESVDTAEVLQFFPVKKMQYWGVLKTGGLPVYGFHKFSLMPLIPTLIENTNLRTMHLKMMEQGIDYALLQSGSKINTITTNGVVDEMFTSNKELAGERTLALNDPNYKFTKNTIFTKYFKDQLEVHDHFSNNVTFSTQMRKLIEEGLMEDGVPSDWRPELIDPEKRVEEWEKLVEEDNVKEMMKSANYRKVIVYEANIAKLVELKKEQLKKEIGNDKKKLIDFIKKELERSDKMSEHELEFVDYDAYTNDLKNALELSLSVDQIEKLLVGIIQKRLISQKVRGEALVQVSNVGFEKVGYGFAKPTKEEIAKYGRDDLAFYKTNEARWEEYLERTLPGPENAKKRESMLNKMPAGFASGAMKVKIALQGDFKKLLNLPDVLDLSVQKGISRLDALNQLIRDEDWLDGRTDPIFKASFAQLNSTKGDTKLFILKSDLTDEVKAQLVPDTKGGLREKGKDYYGIKVLGDYYTHKTLKSGDGDKLDIIVVDSEEDAQRQLDAYIAGGAKQFVDVTPVDLMGSSKRDLITMTAARIPVQGLNSMEFMEVYEFLPEEAGNIVILPAEIVAKSGGDFDIDKMFTIMPNIISNFRTESNDTLDALEKEFGRRIDRKEIKGIEEKFESDEELTEEEENIINFINEFGVGEFYVGLAKGDNIKGVENQLLKNSVGILSMPGNFVSLITPNGIDIIEPTARQMAEKVRGEKKGSKTSPTEIFELERNLYKQQSNNIGKTILGIIAVNNTFNVIFNRVGMRLSRYRVITETEQGPTSMEQVLYLPHNTIKGGISLSGAYAKDQATRISDVINQMINGAVDVAKDAWIFDIQGNKEVISSLIFLLQAGVPVDQAIYFVSQPLIREYIRLQKQYKSKFSVPLVDKDYGTFARVTARDEILLNPKYGFGFKEEDLIGEKQKGTGMDKTTVFAQLENIAKSGNYDKSALEKNISDKTDYDNNDRAVFAHFVQIQEMANHITAVTQALNFDTTKTSTLFDARAKIANVATLANGVPQEVIDRISNESPIGAFKIQDFILEQYHSLFPLRDSKTVVDFMERQYTKQEDGLTPINGIKKQMGIKSGREGDEKFQRLFRNDLISYIFQSSYYAFNPNDKTYKGKDTSFDVKKTGLLTRGALVKDGKLYIDVETIKNQYETGIYAIDVPVGNRTSWANLVAPVAKGTFQDENQYIQYIYERETLRSYPENSLENISKTKEYAKYIQTSGKTGESASFRAYEQVLRDRALDNLNFHGHLFFGPRAYARQVLDLKVTNPALFKKYPVLDNMEGKTMETQSNLKFSNTMLKGDDYSIYAQNLKDLANESIKKSDDDVENLRISKLFQKFPLYAFLQSGTDTSSSFSMVRAVSSTDMLALTKEPYENFLDTLASEEGSDKLDKYLSLFLTQYSAENKYNANKIKNYVELTGLLQNKYLSQVYNLDPAAEGTSPFDIVTDADSIIDDELESTNVNTITINGLPINLTAIGIGFKPNEQQEDALTKIGEFLDSDKKEFTLMGYAGTGKTSITKILLEYIRRSNLSVSVTAPTNKAKTVIANMAGKNAKTIFKALGLKPTVGDPNELDVKNLVFDNKPDAQLKADVLIIDESSFIGDKLLDVIRYVTDKTGTKIIFIGDPAQLKPADQDEVSKTFDVEDKVELTKVERQAGDNPLGPVLDAIRSDLSSPTNKFEETSAILGNEGVIFTNSEDKFIEAAAKAFTSENFKKNRNFVRVVTYLNENVPKFNQKIREKLGYTAEYVPGELLMAYTNLRMNRDGYEISNSMDYIVSSVKYIQEKDITGDITGQQLLASGYELVVQDLLNPKAKPVNVFMLAKENPQSVFTDLAEALQDLARQAGMSNDWSSFYAIGNYVCSPIDVKIGSRTLLNKAFDYAYAHTINKSQGSTYTNIFVDFPSIDERKRMSSKDKNKLKYVGLSRATNIAYTYSKTAKGLSPDVDWNMPFDKMNNTPRVIVSAKTTAPVKAMNDIKTLDKMRVVRDPITGMNYFQYTTEQDLVYGAVPAKNIFTDDFMQLLAADYPNGLFVRNEAVDGGNSIGNNTAYRAMGNRSMGVFSKKGTVPAKFGSPKITNDGWTDATLEDNKAFIDQSIANIVKELEKNPDSFPVFDFNGYGQYLIGYNELNPFSETKPYPVAGKETFLYLSEQLFRNFGFINPHYMEFTQGKKTVQKMSPVTDEELIENFKQCYKNISK